MADGLGYGDNTKAALITRGITEIGRLALAMGAKYETLSAWLGPDSTATLACGISSSIISVSVISVFSSIRKMEGIDG